MKLAIRADGGPEMGYGHVVRSGTVAKEFLDRGHEVLYVTTTPAAIEGELGDRVEIAKVDSDDDLAETVAAIDHAAVDVVFTDLFGADTAYQRRLSETDAHVAVRHNYRRETVCCDLLVYGELEAPDLEYDWVGSEPVMCLGPEYILLREQFRALDEKDHQWRESPERGLIVMGGSDIANVTPAAMRAFDGFDGIVDVVIGPGFGDDAPIEATAASVDATFELRRTPGNIASLMAQADVAVSAIGGTVHELLAVRTPFVAVPVVENQRSRAAALQRHDLALVVDNASGIDDSLSVLLTDHDRRRELFDQSADIVDGEGPRRVYDAMTDL